MTTLTVTSTKQGITFNVGESAAAFAIIEKLQSFAGQVLKAARSLGTAHPTAIPATA